MCDCAGVYVCASSHRCVFEITYAYIHIPPPFLFRSLLNILSDILREYGVAPMSKLLKSIPLFCKRALQKRLYSANEN